MTGKNGRYFGKKATTKNKHSLIFPDVIFSFLHQSEKGSHGLLAQELKETSFHLLGAVTSTGGRFQLNLKTRGFSMNSLGPN